MNLCFFLSAWVSVLVLVRVCVCEGCFIREARVLSIVMENFWCLLLDYYCLIFFYHVSRWMVVVCWLVSCLAQCTLCYSLDSVLFLLRLSNTQLIQEYYNFFSLSSLLFILPGEKNVYSRQFIQRKNKNESKRNRRKIQVRVWENVSEWVWEGETEAKRKWMRVRETAEMLQV